jgi:hypothetical protein
MGMGNGRYVGAHHVYLLKRSDGRIKVGISRDPHRRRVSLERASPETLSILKVVRTFNEPNARRIEIAVKVSLQQYRVRGEWFKCSTILALQTLLDAVKQFPQPRKLEAEQKLKAERELNLQKFLAEQLEISQHRNPHPPFVVPTAYRMANRPPPKPTDATRRWTMPCLVEVTLADVPWVGPAVAAAQDPKPDSLAR